MTKEGSINRGKKWLEVKAKAEFENRTADIKWINEQKSISEDIKNYEDSIKPKEKSIENQTKSKVKK